MNINLIEFFKSSSFLIEYIKDNIPINKIKLLVKWFSGKKKLINTAIKLRYAIPHKILNVLDWDIWFCLNKAMFIIFPYYKKIITINKFDI